MSASRRSRRQALGLDPRIRRLIDGMTRDPRVRAAFYEAMGSMLGDDAIGVFAMIDPAQRACMLLAMRSAADALLKRKSCDICPAVARHVRFMVVRPGENFRGVRRDDDAHLTAFSTLCPACVRLDPADLKARLLDRVARTQARVGIEPYWKEAAIGPAVGEVEHLPPGRSLETCSDCRRPVWIDPDQLVGADRHVRFLCATCAQRAADRGQLECLPVEFLGL